MVRSRRRALEVVETDLGEYLIQIRGETPSHIIAPAIHLTQEQVEADFRRLHTSLPKERQLIEPAQLVAEARQILREKFLAADVGITGANFLIAETGSSVIVTNEGNGDLTQSLPRVHIVLASIEKMVPTLEDVGTLIRLLARSATGRKSRPTQPSPPARRRAGDPDGPQGVPCGDPRQRALGAARHPVPRGAALHPLRGVHEPLPGLRRHRRPCLRLGLSGAHRGGADAGADRRAQGGPPAQRFDVLRALRGRVSNEDSAAQPHAALARGGVRGWVRSSLAARLALKVWAAFARRPRLYHAAARLGVPLLSLFARRGALKLPLAGGWTRHRDLPAPQGRTFQALWADTQAGVPR